MSKLFAVHQKWATEAGEVEVSCVGPPTPFDEWA